MLNYNLYPHGYRAYGLDILSQFPILGLESAKVQKPEVIIREGSVPDELPDAINRGVLYQASKSAFLLNVDGVARYFAYEGKEIIVERESNASMADVSAFLNGTILGALLHQRRMLPLHASTVIFQGKGILFAGMSGAGKSTLAAALIEEGATLVSDDISVFNFFSNKTFVLPAFPSIKLWEDSLQQLGMNDHQLIPVRDELRKYYLPVKRFSSKPVAIDHIYILRSHNRFDIQIKDLQGIDKFTVLKKHTYLFRGIPNTGLETNHFILVNRLASHLPITMLTRPNAEFNPGRLIEEISGHLTKIWHG